MKRFKKTITFLLFFVLLSSLSLKIVYAAGGEANKHYLDAYNLYKLGKLDESLKMLKKVIEINPEHPEAHFGMGSIYFRKNDFEKAVEEFSTVTRLKPKYVEAYQRLWLAYKKLGMNDKAEQELLKYRKLIEERMQAMSGGSPQVVKPVKPKKKKEEPKSQKASIPEEPEPEKEEVAATKVEEKQPEKKEEVKPETKETVAEKPKETKSEAPPAPVHIEKPEPSRTTVKPKSQVVSPLTRETRPKTLRSPLTELKYTPHLDTKYDESLYIKYKDHATYQGAFQKVKSLFSGLFKGPKKDGGGIQFKAYFGKLVKGFAFFTILIQVWLCVFAVFCIYFSKTKNNDKTK